MATAQGLVTTLPPGDVVEAVEGVEGADATQRLAALRLAGAAGLDPLRLHFLEALARRAPTQPDNVQGILQARLAQGIAELQARLEQAQPAVPSGALGPAGAANAAPASDSVTASLSALTRYLALHAAAHEGVGVGLGVGVGAGTLAPVTDPELKSVRHFRNTWSKLSVHKQLSQALDTAPKNAGPINSHMLVLRSLALMREISPDYLNRFMSYADTLLCLELGAAEVPSEGKAGKAARAPRSRVR